MTFEIRNFIFLTIFILIIYFPEVPICPIADFHALKSWKFRMSNLF